jgi:hypothetical protein
MEMDCLMVKEDGQWKFDLSETMNRMFGGNLEEAVEQIGDAVGKAMGEAMKGVGDAIGEGLRAAFGEGSGEPAQPNENWDEAVMSYSSDELLPVPMFWKNLPKTQAALTEAVGSRVLVMADLKNLLVQTGADDADELLKWFEYQLFAGWGAMLAQVPPNIPLTGRLRALRIETATRVENHLLAIDGSDLVYRMMLPYNEGFFQDDQVAALLPGVLAGLPNEIDSSVAGFRLLPLDEEKVDLGLYRQRTAPRYMKRISDLLGHHVALDANWDELGECEDAGRTLAMWGLNRIYGGIAFACQDAALRDQLVNGLSGIRILLTYEVAKCYARYADGVLEFGLKPYGGADAGRYEHEFAQALSGVPTQEAKPAEPDKPAKSKKRKSGKRK